MQVETDPRAHRGLSGGRSPSSRCDPRVIPAVGCDLSRRTDEDTGAQGPRLKARRPHTKASQQAAISQTCPGQAAPGASRRDSASTDLHGREVIPMSLTLSHCWLQIGLLVQRGMFA